MCVFLNRSRFVSRATIELNRALELSLRFARHPSIETRFFSFLLEIGVFLYSSSSYTSCIQNIESRIISLSISDEYILISMEEDDSRHERN